MSLYNRYTPVQWAERACKALMDAYSPDALRAEYVQKDEKGRRWAVPGPGNQKSLEFFGARWRYNHGLFMVALQTLYRATGNEEFLEYTKQWADDRIDEEGNICVNISMLDSIQPGLALFLLWEKFGEKRYKIALDTLRKGLDTLAVTDAGVWAHTNKLSHEVWLDGVYMSEVFLMYYEEAFGDKKASFQNAMKHLDIIFKQMFVEETGLLCHGYDESKAAAWANPETGCSDLFWSRSIGWVMLTLVELLERCPKEFAEYDKMKAMLMKLYDSVLKYQDEESGLWYQLIDRAEDEKNWLETSASTLFLYAIAKGIRMNLLDRKYITRAERCYQGLFAHIEDAEEGFILYDVCQGTCVSNVPDYYYDRGRICNDYHGVSVFVLAALEYQKMIEENN